MATNDREDNQNHTASVIPLAGRRRTIPRRADATGRSGRRSGKRGKGYGPPPGASWVWLTAELLASAPWQARSLACAQLIDQLLLDHMAHAGTENGRLVACYADLARRGVDRFRIACAILEAQALGLVRITERGSTRGSAHLPARYQLTFLPTADLNGHAIDPSNDWRAITAEEAKVIVKAHRARRRDRKWAERNSFL